MNDQEKIERMRAATAWHLQNNFIPPYTPELVDYCLQAIEACNSDDPTRLISLPGGVTVTAEELVDDLRVIDMLEDDCMSNVTILGNAQKALALLIEADDIVSELGNRGLLNYKKSSAMAKYFFRVLQPLRELIEYVEKELT